MPITTCTPSLGRLTPVLLLAHRALLFDFGNSAPSFFSFLFFLKFIYLFLRERERERESTSGGGTERRRDRITSRLRTISAEPDVGLELMNHELVT